MSSSPQPPFLEQVPCPPQLSEQSIAQLMPDLPLLDEHRLSPELAACAAKLRSQLTNAASNAQTELRAVRDAWIAWHSLPNISPVAVATSLSAAARLSQPTAPDTEFAHTISVAQNIANESFMRDVFDRHADCNSNQALSAPALMAALKAVEAPILHSCGSTEENMFRRADTNLSGAVEFEEFMRAAQLPDELEMLLEDDRLSMIAPALRACISGSDNPVTSFADVSEEALFGAVDASIHSIKHQLLQTHRRVKSAVRAKAKIQEEMDREPSKKFSIREMSTGSIDDFHEGLHDRIGSPNLDFLKAMRAEHVTKGGHDHLFVTGNYKLKTQARLEWLYVAGDESGQRTELPASDAGHGRVIQSIDDLLQKPLTKAAQLTREEVISIVMYSGPAFVLYNAVLRRFPADIYEVFKAADNLFSTTIFVLVSAINKLSRCANIPTGTLLYRGLGGTLEFPERFTRPDPSCKTPNALGFLEYGFMSTTADKSIAVQYSGVKEGKPKAGILQIRPNSVDRGADISEFSQYAAEKEYLFVPYSFVQGEGRQRTEVTEGGGVLTVVPVHVNINLKTETVDELKQKKKRLHLASAGAIVEEVRYELEQWAASAEAAARLQRDLSRNHQGGTFTAATYAAKIVEQCDAVLKRHREMGMEEYVDDGVFRGLVSEMLDTKAWAIEKKELWMQGNATQYIGFLQGYSLRSCHRTWEQYLRQSMTGADGASAGLRLLKSRGLVKQGVQKETNSDGENVMVQAGADGWSVTDIFAAAAAGADVCAMDSGGMSGVYHAARYGHLDSLTALLKAGGDANKCNNVGASPIWIAARNGNASCIQQLVSCKGDVTKCNNQGYSPIFVAAEEGDASCIELLVSCKGDVTKCGNDGMSPIWIAAQLGHASIIELLVSCKGDVSQCDDDGASPICIAAENGHAPCISQLLASRADPRSSWNGTSALEIARAKSHAECVRVLEAALQ